MSEIISATVRRENKIAASAAVVILDEDGEMRHFDVDSDHGNFDSVLDYLKLYDEYLEEGDDDGADDVADNVLDLLSDSRRVRKGVRVLESETNGRFTFENEQVRYEGERLNESLENHIIRIIHAGEEGSGEWKSFAKFVENLFNNSDAYIREQLFEWMKSARQWDEGFTLTDDGCFIAYKGLTSIDGVPYSKFRGVGSVERRDENGNLVVDEYENSQIPNVVGTSVFMPRSLVTNDPATGCAPGLHVATFSYARTWAENGSLLISVKVNPRDVVSVPTECDAQKIRTSRYTILEAVETVYKSTTAYFDDGDYSDYDDGYDDGYDGYDDWGLSIKLTLGRDEDEDDVDAYESFGSYLARQQRRADLHDENEDEENAYPETESDENEDEEDDTITQLSELLYRLAQGR